MKLASIVIFLSKAIIVMTMIRYYIPDLMTLVFTKQLIYRNEIIRGSEKGKLVDKWKVVISRSFYRN